MNDSRPDGPGVSVNLADLFADSSLSFRAKGLFALISTFEDRRGLTAETLAGHSREGMSAVKAGLRELEASGHLVRHRQRAADGTLGLSTYLIASDEPTPTADIAGLAYAITDPAQPFVKIGCTTDLRNRLATLQTSWPGQLQVIWQAPGGAALEAHLHQRFAGRRVRGEWFDFGDGDAAVLIAVAALAFGGSK